VLFALTLVRHHSPLPRWTSYEIPIALLLLAGVIGIFVAPDHRGALGIFRAYLLEPILVCYIATAVLTTANEVERLLMAWGAGAFVFALLDIATFFHAAITGTLQPGHAAAAFDINPNSVAMYLEPLIGLAAGFSLFTQGRRRWAVVALLAVLLVAEIVSLSRGGLLALAALVFVGLLSVHNLRFRITVAIAAVVGSLGIWTVPLVGSRIAHAIDPVSGTVFGRERIWVATLRMLREHPIFGAGLDSYQTTMAPYRLADTNLVPEPYPHNIILTSWTELGLLGLAAFLYLLISLTVRPWRALARASGLYRPLLWGLGAGFVMIAVHGLVDSPYWQNDLSVEFWLLAALEVVAIRSLAGPALAHD
jgi:O-antigen ligase